MQQDGEGPFDEADLVSVHILSSLSEGLLFLAQGKPGPCCSSPHPLLKTMVSAGLNILNIRLHASASLQEVEPCP